jgi:hypothetical protein
MNKILMCDCESMILPSRQFFSQKLAHSKQKSNFGGNKIFIKRMISQSNITPAEMTSGFALLIASNHEL